MLLEKNAAVKLVAKGQSCQYTDCLLYCVNYPNRNFRLSAINALYLSMQKIPTIQCSSFIPRFVSRRADNKFKISSTILWQFSINQFQHLHHFSATWAFCKLKVSLSTIFFCCLSVLIRHKRIEYFHTVNIFRAKGHLIFIFAIHMREPHLMEPRSFLFEIVPSRF